MDTLRREERFDLYPSRVGGEAKILERKDPVLHGDPDAQAQGPLGPEELERFERDGFLFFRGFFPEERIRESCERLEQMVEERQDDLSPEVVREPDSDEIRSFFRVHESEPVFGRLARDRRLVGIAEQILGSRVYIHQSRVNRKPGFDGKEFYWHSDFETWHVEDGLPRMRAVSAAINLTENFPFNGPLMVIPGSHRYYVSCAGYTPEKHYLKSLRKQEYGVPRHEHLRWLVEQGGGIAAPTGPPGSVLLFECNVMHASAGNITPYPRSNLFFVFNSVENALEQPFSGQPPRPEHIGSRKAEPVEPED